MAQLSKKENRLISVFLEEFKKMLDSENVPFNPRNLTIVSQPDLKNGKRFDFISYNQWFDELNVVSNIGSCDSLLQSFLEVPINILISAEEIGKPMLSKKDKNKIIKALKLLKDIKIERQK